ERRYHRPRPLDGGLAEVDADHTPGRTHHLRQYGKRADGAAAAVDGRPPCTDAHPAERALGGLPGNLSDAQQSPQVLIAAIEDVAPNLLRSHFSHALVLPTMNGVQFSLVRRRADSRRYTQAPCVEREASTLDPRIGRDPARASSRAP